METFFPQSVTIMEKRRSIRSFSSTPLSDESEAQLKKFLLEFNPPFAHCVNYGIYRNNSQNAVLYLFKEPPFFFHICSSNDILDQAKMGFIGQVFLLFANSLGISTCWYGHFREKNVYNIVYGEKKSQPQTLLHCISPLGYLAEKQSFLSNISVKKFGKKKNVAQNLVSESLMTFPDSINKALQLACNSPSGLNSQPWTFLVKDTASKYLIIITKPIGFRILKWPYPNIDVGTAAAQFWLGMKAQNIPIEIELHSEHDRAVWEFSVNKSAV